MPWMSVKPMPTVRQVREVPRNAIVLSNGMVLVAGGADVSTNAVVSCVLFHPPDVAPPIGKWTATSDLALGRRSHSLTELANGRVLAAGGIVGPFQYPWNLTNTVEIYRPGNRTWVHTAPMSVPRSDHAAILLADGKVLVAGGQTIVGGTRNPTSAAAEIYDPRKETWTPAADMISPRGFPRAVRLDNGDVLFAGADTVTGPGNAVNALPNCEVFTPNRGIGSWTATSPLTEPLGRSGHSVSLLVDGRVLAVGGFADEVSPAYATCELYDPNTHAWSPTGQMGAGRVTHQAVVLSDGTVLVLGGAADFNAHLSGIAGVEQYKLTSGAGPQTGTWSPFDSANFTGRYMFASALLPAPPGTTPDRVLALGGFTSDAATSATAAAELYTYTPAAG